MRDAPPPSWRDSGSDRPQPPPPSRGWQGGGEVAPNRAARSGRFFKRVFAIVFLVGLLVGIGLLIVMPARIRPTCLVLIGASYDQNLLLPHNAYGWNGLNKLRQVCAPDGFTQDWLARLLRQPAKPRRAGDIIELKEKTAWKDAWKEFLKHYADPDKQEKNVIFYFSLHGFSDDDDAYLLRDKPGIQSPDEFNQSRIKFREVLDSLKELTLKGKNVIVLLDVCHFDAHWPIGTIKNDFVERLERKYGQEISETPNLTVICSTGHDEHSWESDELQTTWFAHHVAQALRGVDCPDSGVVTALSLFEKVRDKVERDVRVNRGRKQTPILIGAKAEETARNAKLVHIDAEAPPESPGTEVDLSGLKEAWARWKNLKADHAPHVHAPHWWRLYQATLLRHEQLLRAGNPTGNAAKLAGQLPELEREIIAAKAISSFQCVGNNFAVHRVLGYAPKQDAAVTDAMLEAYFDGDADVEKVVLGKYGAPIETSFLFARMGRLAWNKKLADATDFDGLRSRFDKIGENLLFPHRPVELQLLKMLADASPSLGAETARLALRVRQLAEEAALSVPPDETGRAEPYAEIIFRQVKDRVESTDRIRRQGEDLLFGAPDDHVKAAEKLKDARTAYEGIRKDAETLRTALSVRDEIAADLPFIAAWLAASYDKEKTERLRQDAVALGAGLALLQRKLTGAGDPPDSDAMLNLVKLLGRVGKEYSSIASDLRRPEIKLQKDWHEIEALLAAPPLNIVDKGNDPVTLRMQLLEQQRKISRHHATAGSTGQIEGGSRSDRRARCNALMAACLAPYGIGEDDLPKAREFFLTMPAAIGKADKAEQEKTLQTAGNDCRVIPAGLVDPLRNEKTGKRINPVDRLRRVRVFHLLHWLAERTRDDHWYDGDTPYYLPMAADYVACAGSLFAPELPLSLREVRLKLEPAGLKIGADPSRYWTTEPTFPVEWKIDVAEGVPHGTPVAWLEVKKPPKDAARKPVGARKTIDMSAQKRPYAVAFELMKDPAVTDGDVATLHAFYRGQHLPRDLVISRPPPALLVHNPPAPTEVGFAVRMDSGFDYGAISIVLDNSISMKYVYPEKGAEDKERPADRNKNEDQRFDYALRAVEHVLGKTPNGTSLSVYCFGRGEKTSITPIRAPKPWHHSQIEGLRDEIKNLPLKYASPIAQGLVTAMTDGFPAAKGPKIVVVLTDGDDNSSFESGYYDSSPEDVKDKHIDLVAGKLGQTLRDSKHAGVRVLVVCFIQPSKGANGASTEYERARRQFKGIEDPGLPTPGKLIMESQGAELGKRIEQYLRPRVKLSVNGRPAAPEFTEGRPVDYYNENTLNWEPVVDARNYKASILQIDKNEFDVNLADGRSLFAILRRSGPKLILERGLLAKQKEVLDVVGAAKPHENEDWWGTMMECHQNPFGQQKLSQLIALEKADVAGPVLRPIHPGFVWLQIELEGKQKLPTALTWGRDWSLPAAAYRAEVPRWPIKQDPMTTVWFWPEERGDFLTNNKFKLNFEAKQRVSEFWTGDLSKLTRPPIDSVVFQRDVTLETMEGAELKRDCVVVRFHFPPGQPIFVDLKAVGADNGSLHKYYLDAGKGTAYFYGSGIRQQEPVDLVWFDIDDFKKSARKTAFDSVGSLRFKVPDMFVVRRRN